MNEWVSGLMYSLMKIQGLNDKLLHNIIHENKETNRINDALPN